MTASPRLRILLVLGAVCVVIVLAGIFLGVTGGATWKLTPSPNTLLDATAFGQDTVVFSNGRSFVSYNYVSGHSKLLSPDNISSYLDNIDKIEVSSDDQYLIFHTTALDAGNALYDKARTNGIDPNQPSWWVYSLARQSFQNLPQNVTSVRVSGQKLYALAGDTQQNISLYSLSGLQQLASYSVPSCIDFYPIAGGVVLLTADNHIVSTQNYIVYNQLFSAANILNVAPDGRFGLGTLQTKKGQNLVLFDLQKKNYHLIDSDVAAQLAWTTQNDALYTKNSSGSSIAYLYNAASHRVATLHFTGSKIPKTFLPSSLFDTKAAILSDSNNNSYLVGKNITPPKTVTSSYSSTITTGGRPLDITYYPDQTAFILTLDATSAQQEEQAVYARLTKDGYNPELFNIRMTLFTPPEVFN